ncbi:hypothetical protein LJC63_11520 [Ruminococcaceae bacterium OttesenSCG-928-L11]|nr:hypothetical protein [Ruminococcaceae bacterium OttesenSCG-928-L11]
MSKLIDCWDDLYTTIGDIQVEVYILGLIENTYCNETPRVDSATRYAARQRTVSFIQDYVCTLECNARHLEGAIARRGKSAIGESDAAGT